MKQMQQEIQQVSGQNGFRFTTVAHRANRLLSIIGEFPIPQFQYITPNYLFHLTSNDYEYFISKVRERQNNIFEHFAGAQW